MDPLPIRLLNDRIAQLEARVRSKDAAAGRFQQYVRDPVAYFVNELKLTPTPDQERILRACVEPPYRVMVKSGHNIGKTCVAAGIVNWWYDTRDPGVAITTAPTERDVIDLLWTEVRLQRQRAGRPDTFIGPRAPEMRTGEEHYAKGYTANTGESFQGRHRPHMLFLFEEAEGIEAVYWKTANTMFQPDGTNLWLAILNPVTTTSQSYQEERRLDADGKRKWRTFSLSSLDHPNIAAQLKDEPPPIPTAVTLEQVRTWLNDWFEPVAADERDEDLDVEFPPASGKWWRPGPDGESRVLGRRPSAGTFGIWSERLWQRVTTRPLAHDLATDRPEIGCDVARFGDDRTEIHVRVGPCSHHHEDAGGWDTVRTADRLMSLADWWAAWTTKLLPTNSAPVDPRAIRIKVDDTGVGGGVTDILKANGFYAVPVNAGEAAQDVAKYPRVRDELWFAVARRAREGRLDLSRLGPHRLAALQVQALAPVWTPTPKRQRKVETKEDTKERIGRSPDGMDALNLAYYEVGGPAVAEWIESPPKADDRRDPRSGRTWMNRRR